MRFRTALTRKKIPFQFLAALAALSAMLSVRWTGAGDGSLELAAEPLELLIVVRPRAACERDL